MGIKWTNANVKNLGIYFGNDNPAKQTFDEMTPSIKRSLNYWKQFKLSKFAKSRVIEIFHSSKLWYAATFYPIPEDTIKQLKTAFLDYINFPRQNRPTVSQQEMAKLRMDGGLKLINIQTKSETSKIMWLMELLHKKDLNLHKAFR